MRRSVVLLAIVAIAAGYAVSRGAGAENAQVTHGKYLVQLAGCTDCHTPGHLLGKPDMSRFLGGSDVGFEVPDLGTFVGPNLTPDNDTGLGNWTKEEVATAINGSQTRRSYPRPNNAVACLCRADAIRYRRHRRLPEEPSAGQS
jgi:mono/diheme cytochrome c family protein